MVFDYVGDGPALDKLRDKCKVLEIRRVIFTGRIAENIYSYFFMCDVYVLPSLGGLAINDAMMCGKAVIVGSADGTEKDLIVDGITGHLLKSKDDRSLIVELADKIEQILRNKDKYTQMGEAGFEHYMKVSSFEKMVDAFEHAVFETLKGKY